MKTLFFIFSIVVSTSTFAQDLVIFDKNEKTNLLFDESDPYSFISLLKLNAFYHGYNNLHGIDIEVFNGLNPDEKKHFLCYKGKDSDIPLIDGDPNSINFGEYLIEELPDGTLSYVYPDRDSVLIRISGVDRIVFTLNEGSGQVFERVKEIQLWKRFESGMHCVMKMDATRFLSFNELNVVQPVSQEWTDKILGKHVQPSLWSVMRDSSLNHMQWYRERSEENVYHGWFGNGVQTLFPNYFSAFFLNQPHYIYEYESQERDDYLSSYFGTEEIYPVSLELSNKVNDYTVDKQEIYSLFDSVYVILEQSDVPLIDEDPDSPRYGYELLVERDGLYYNVYSAPREEYFFADYDPLIFVSKQVLCDSLNQCRLVPTNLLFCMDVGKEQVELISIFDLDFDNPYQDRTFYKQYLEGFSEKDLWEQEQFVSLKAMINNKKYGRTLSFEESTIPCEPCANKKGYYALCWKGNAITPYQYERISTPTHDGYFEAQIGDRKYMLDGKGKELFSEVLDIIYAVEGYPGVYIGQKGDKWMIYSVSNEYQMPLTQIKDAEYEFLIDGNSYANFGQLFLISIDENGKSGLINTRGQELIAHHYAELHKAETYGYNTAYKWCRLTSAVARIGSSNQWQVFDTNFQKSITVSGEEFLHIYGDYLLFKVGERIIAYQATTGIETPGLFNLKTTSTLSQSGLRGTVDSTGRIMIPFKYRDIGELRFDTLLFYIASKNEQAFDIYDSTGRLVQSYEEHAFYGVVCQGLDNFYRITKDGQTGVIRYNSLTQQFETLFEVEFTDLSCSSLEPDKPIASAKVQSGEAYLLFRDGHKVLNDE